MSQRPRIAPMVIGGVLLAVLFFGAAALRGRLAKPTVEGLPDRGEVADFALQSQTGREVTRADLLGKVWIADFIFTHCAGPCPRMTADLARISGDLTSFPDLRLVSFSVDPERDTPAVLADYARGYSADAERWYFLTGDKAAIFKLARESFHVGAADGDTTDDPVLHSTRFVLVDRAGKVRGHYDSTDPAQLAALSRDAATLHGSPAAR
jgi:cytochrome oxidase Cu insertion factor (SCO1/SenC/PrrC family)